MVPDPIYQDEEYFMNDVFVYLMSEFVASNPLGTYQQRIPNGWEVLDEVGIGDELTIVDHWALYKVAQVFGSDCYVFARTADGMITDFGWSHTPDCYARWFDEG